MRVCQVAGSSLQVGVRVRRCPSQAGPAAPAPLTSAQKLSHSTRLLFCCAGSISSRCWLSNDDTTPTRTPKKSAAACGGEQRRTKGVLEVGAAAGGSKVAVQPPSRPPPQTNPCPRGRLPRLQRDVIAPFAVARHRLAVLIIVWAHDVGAAGVGSRCIVAAAVPPKPGQPGPAAAPTRQAARAVVQLRLRTCTARGAGVAGAPRTRAPRRAGAACCGRGGRARGRSGWVRPAASCPRPALVVCPAPGPAGAAQCWPSPVQLVTKRPELAAWGGPGCGCGCIDVSSQNGGSPLPPWSPATHPTLASFRLL